MQPHRYTQDVGSKAEAGRWRPPPHPSFFFNYECNKGVQPNLLPQGHSMHAGMLLFSTLQLVQ